MAGGAPIATKLKCCIKFRRDMHKLNLGILLAVCLHRQTNLCKQNQTIPLARMLECRMQLLVSCISSNSVFTMDDHFRDLYCSTLALR